ncbi:EAL domain-containing protein [Pelosinus sp. sgz500959]|uniref:EAL domain-containing protein n=1 Tax=Pelosinus sp. sgz500959 TaxID=3242472 RepID=UPI0036714BD2
MFKNYSYRNKLLLWVMPILVVGLLTLGFGAHWYIEQVIRQELTTSMLATTDKAAEGIDTWCRTLVMEPETIASTPAAKTINSGFDQIDQLNLSRNKALHQKYPDIFRDIYAANREGIYHTVQENLNGYSLFEGNISNRDYFKSIMSDGRTQLTPPLMSRTSGAPTIFAVAPIIDDNGIPQGLIGAGISLDYVQKIAQSLKAGQNGYGILLSQDGTFVYHPDPSYIMQKKINDLPDSSTAELGLLMMSGGSGIKSYIYNGQKKIAFYSSVPFAGWSVATVIPEEEFFAPATRMAKWLTMITLLIISVVGLVIWFAAQRLTQPLQDLAAYAWEISEGNLVASSLVPQSSDEIGSLTRNFNQMTANLLTMMGEMTEKNKALEEEASERKKAEVALRQVNEKLEYKVEERTQELYTSNEELTAMNEEIQAINETLSTMNQQLQEEITYRQQTQEQLLLREKQYRASTSLLTGPVDNMPGLLNSILNSALKLVKAPDGYISLYESTDKGFTIQQGAGLHEQRIQHFTSNEGGMQKQVYETGEMLYVENYQTFPQRMQEPIIDPMTSIIMIPLKYGGQVQGVLVASWQEQIHYVNTDDVEIMRQFGDLAAVAIERLHIQEQIRERAFHDALTGLPNRANLNLELEKELTKARAGKGKGIVLFIDLDDLKTINDNFGHFSGDRVIISAGQHIVAAVGENAFVARQGGDEFIVIVSGDKNRKHAAEVADNILEALSQDYEVMGQSFHMSASIGVALYPSDADNVEDILKKADSAMYAAKEAGRNRWKFYEPSLMEEAYHKMVWTNGLRRALERKELYLHYQPQLDVHGLEIVGFEALLRWQSAEYGNISPLQFIPLAEHSGLIQPIGKWVLEEACRFARRLEDLGRGNVKVAVNISTKQLLATDFVEHVYTSIATAGISPEQLELEVTESILIERVDESLSYLEQLRDFGIRLALDDFGTGYSSLTYLKNLPVKILKIDKSFIDHICVDQTQLQLVGSIIQMGHNLDLHIVAEGVETVEQFNLLKTLNCDRIQGYIFSRPLPADEAIAFKTKK